MRSTNSAVAPVVNLEPMTRQQAEKLVDRLLAGFPQLNLRDPEGYIAALVQVMSGYPAWAGEEVVFGLVGNPDFPPSDRRLHEGLAQAVRPYRFAIEWNARAEKQLAERYLLEPPPLETVAEPTGEVFTDLAAALKRAEQLRRGARA